MKKLLIVFVVSMFGLLDIGSGAVSIKQEDRPGKAPLLRVENEFIRFVLDPDLGGRMISLVYLPVGKEMATCEGADRGLLLDLFAGETFGAADTPAFAKYDYQIVASNADEAAVALSYRPVSEKLPAERRDIGIIKKVVLRAGSPVIQVETMLENHGKEDRKINFWSKHDLILNGDRERDTYFRPDIFGIAKGWFAKQKAVGDDRIQYPVAGWSAVTDEKTKENVVFLMDYNDLQWLYNCICANSVEWWYDWVSIPPGKTWKTQYWIVPRLGFSGFSHASAFVLADNAMKEDKNGVALDFTLAATDQPLTNVVIETKAVELFSGKEYPLPLISCAVVSNNPANLTTLLSSLPGEPLFFKVNIAGQTKGNISFKEDYEYFTPKQEKSCFSIQASGVAYRRSQPVKNKKLLKPDVMNVSREGPLTTLYIEGLHHEHYKIQEVLAGMHMPEPTRVYMQVSSFGASLKNFPAAYSVLLKHDTAVLANIDARALGATGMLMLRDFVEAGGVLLVLGGLNAYGQGDYKGSVLEEMLPVTVMGSADWIKCEPSAVLAPGRDAPADWRALAYEKHPACYWMHEVKLKPDALEVLTAGGKPFLSVRRLGKGWVLACAGSVCGEAEPGTIPFWEWNDWGKVLKGCLKYGMKE